MLYLAILKFKWLQESCFLEQDFNHLMMVVMNASHLTFLPPYPWFNAVILYFSHFLYPNKKFQIGDNGEENTPCSGDGKYELLSITNNIIAEEMRILIQKSKPKLLLSCQE